jgi:hypothetical protein
MAATQQREKSKLQEQSENYWRDAEAS